MRVALWMAAGWIAMIAGCSSYAPAPPPPTAGQPAAAKQTPAKAAPAAATAGQPGQTGQGSGMTAGMSAMGGAIGMAPLETAVGGPGAVPPARPAANPAAPAPTPPGGMVAQPYKVGVGQQDRGYGTGPIATPMNVYFNARNNLAASIQIADALRLFKATNGRGPKDHQEFEQKIIRENNIQLPELRQGEYYQYDPATETLNIMRPPQ